MINKYINLQEKDLLKIQNSEILMQNQQNHLQMSVHNKIMQNLRQRQLQYKTKIIQLQKQKQYETNRANEYQQKFKEAMLNSGDEVSLIEKLSQKENENNMLRKEVFRLRKSADTQSQSSDPKASQDLIQANKQLTSQNEQLVKTIEELKNAAISAIMSKDDEIQELGQKISRAQELAVVYQNLLEREESLEKEIQRIRNQAEQQQRTLSQKLARQREKYLQKLQQFQHNLQNQQSSKQQLLQKAQLLQTNLQNKQQVIQLYENKLHQFQSAFRHQRNLYQQEKEKLKVQLNNLEDKHALYQREITNLQKVVAEYSFKERQSKILTQRLKDENVQLQRKITIKKRKGNPKVKSSDIYSSFEGISQKSSFYSSFYKPTEQTKPSTLGQIEELEENDVIDSFIDLEERIDEKEIEEKPISHNKKQQRSLDIEISTHENKNQLINDVKDESSKEQSLTDSPQQPIISSVQLDAIRESLQLSQKEINSLKERNEILKQSLQQSYSEIERLTNEILAKTTEIQTQRQALAQLRVQNKKSQSEKELIVELENYKQHVYKLENALLIEKLQNAEKQEFIKERTQRERKTYEDKISRLDEEVKNLSPKKKKGFFR